jgi:methionyl-tRNA formyltransferase
MRLIMMGTGPYAVPTFESLYQTPHEVLVLVTRPPRGRRPPPNPMRESAEAHGTRVWMPESINDEKAQAELDNLRPDLLVVCDYGEILRPETLAAARLGGINLHASLLPKYRGAAPINWALYHGEQETGNTVIQMTPGLDAGPCIGQIRTTIEPDETAVELEERLAVLGATAVGQAIEDLDAGSAKPIEQDPALASLAPRLKKTDGLIDWSRSARQIHNQVRAMQPWPGSYTFWQRSGREPVRLILQQVAVAAADEVATIEEKQPGTVVSVDDRLLVATGSGLLDIVELQPAGKRRLAAAEFLRGQAVRPGDMLGASRTDI